MSHLPVLPILIPLFAAALALFFEHRRFGILPQRVVAWTSMLSLLVVVEQEISDIEVMILLMQVKMVLLLLITQVLIILLIVQLLYQEHQVKQYQVY